MSNKAVLDALTIGTPTTKVGQFNVFGDSSISGVLNIGGTVVGGAVSVMANTAYSTTGNTIVIDSFSTVEYRAAEYAITIDGSSSSVKRYLFTTLYVLQDEDDVYTTEQGTLFNRTLGTFSANVDTSKTTSSTNIVNILFTPTTSERLTIKLVRTGFYK